MSLSSGILTIGNEVVDGQILNRNASWLASQLINLGFKVTTHLSVSDSDNDIQSAIRFMESRCQVIVTTGGLGPTIDDLTSKAIANWASLPLELSIHRWDEIKNKLKARQLIVRDGHKSQALFPKNAITLDNQKGVAPGFILEKGKNLIVSLPGPPNELQMIWDHSLKNILKEKYNPKSNRKLYTWICLGAPESEIAHIVDGILNGKDIDYGFRIHKPYVEVKVWADSMPNEYTQSLFQKISSQLQTWHVGTSIENIRQRFYEKLKEYSQIYMIDHLTQGLFLDRIKEYRLPENMRYQTYFENSKQRKLFNRNSCIDIINHLKSDEHSLCIGLFPLTHSESLILINDKEIKVELPRSISSASQFGQLYTVEMLFTKGFNQTEHE